MGDDTGGAGDLTEIWRSRAWAAHPELLCIGAAGARPRAVARWGRVVGADLGVPHPWGVQLSAGDRLPSRADAASALAWCRQRDSGSGWWVALPSTLSDPGPWGRLVEHDRSGMYATDAATAATLPVDLPQGIDLLGAPSREEVVDAYGGWMGDPPLARQLVTEQDMARPDRRFLVASQGGTPVGCALVWWARGTGYLSGIGVVPSLRGRGIGRALTAAAARLAAQRADVVWMISTTEGAALYGRMGFRRIDVVVHWGE